MGEDKGFDYGERLEDGQFENHPTKDKGDFVQPPLRTYIHEECGGATQASAKIAKSIARDPNQYDKTFCKKCGDYFPVEQFHWKKNGEPWEMEVEP